ncbi:hypothetical protein [Dactylosporangium sp. CA-139066]|uniref:hypothetical protein n=1 Tax=Dactylosporangium sp. CA-139066 TaxID=3239930 RepID=UPI003D9023DE
MSEEAEPRPTPPETPPVEAAETPAPPPAAAPPPPPPPPYGPRRGWRAADWGGRRGPGLLIVAVLLGCLLGGAVTACGALVVGAVFHHGEHGRYDTRYDKHPGPGEYRRDWRGPGGPGPVQRPPKATPPAPAPTTAAPTPTAS